mmetsp:Transcript_34602/g.89711  ORF Transcript_34602/g.89711 Transcript_34602/m.89711 type:complete len:282 (+) Transcript_34602:2777-3622(+)
MMTIRMMISKGVDSTVFFIARLNLLPSGRQKREWLYRHKALIPFLLPPSLSALLSALLSTLLSARLSFLFSSAFASPSFFSSSFFAPVSTSPLKGTTLETFAADFFAATSSLPFFFSSSFLPAAPLSRPPPGCMAFICPVSLRVLLSSSSSSSPSLFSFISWSSKEKFSSTIAMYRFITPYPAKMKYVTKYTGATYLIQLSSPMLFIVSNSTFDHMSPVRTWKRRSIDSAQVPKFHLCGYMQVPLLRATMPLFTTVVQSAGKRSERVTPNSCIPSREKSIK